MATATVLEKHKEATLKEQRVARFAGVVTGLFTVLWAVLLSGAFGDYDAAPLPWTIAAHGRSLLSALIVYFYCRHVAHRTRAAGLLCFVAVAFFFADVGLSFQYSPYFGIALMAWGASARRPLLAGSGVLALGAAILARVEHESGVLAIAGSGVMILATALAMRPKNPSMSQQSAS
ncbi:hypothetical protein [Paenarthrobacter aurescens]|uniref:hypothetical protein n=1 Tax=Paenarthrobacter aurescens TaxID=43663 RepID=UPI0021C05A2B|nr:hypothetical protein [Paenarthrobacter aurescens]MCT9870870.1 hypothetical protein [Paenarthrobacter aurescens]